jgi:hypothetical protein
VILEPNKLITMTTLHKYLSGFLILAALAFGVSCEKDLDELEPATFPTTAAVFIDGFSGGLNYDAFGGSKVTAFEVDMEVKYQGSSSMRISVPDQGDPAGGYAGGVYSTDAGRDLSGYTALTFWAKASKSANVDVFGIGNDLGENRYVASISDVPLTSNWQKYYIPIPDPSKLTAERGMFYYSEAPEEGRGYTFWIDEVKFENLGTIVLTEAGIFNGEEVRVTAETGDIISPEGYAVFNLPEAVDQRMSVASAYFDFTSSNPGVASTAPNGSIAVLDAGEAMITATLRDTEAEGSVTVVSTGEAVLPATAAPTPDEPAEDVISIYSNTYEDEPVDFYNGFWEFSTTLNEEIQVAGDDIMRYTQLNFVGIQFTTPTIDISEMTHFHIDFWTPNSTDPPAEFKIEIVDLGPDGTFEGGDNAIGGITATRPTLQTGSWVSLDVPLRDLPGLATRGQLAQIVLSSNVLSTVFVDNVYFYDDGSGGGGGGGDDEPAMAAPAPPARNAADVISLFSDAYDDVPVDTWRTEWSSATFEDVTVAGNATKKYSSLDFVGIETVMNQLDIAEMTHFHLDVWSPNFTSFRAVLVDFGPDGGFEGGDDSEQTVQFTIPPQGEWVSYDIALSDLTELTGRNNFAQLILGAMPAGDATVFVDNIYFYKGDGGGGGGDEPTAAAPAPTLPAGDVISLFSDAYDDVPVDTWRTEWSMAEFEDVMVAGNPTKKYTALDFVGIETVMNQLDITGMTHFHIDIWSPDFESFRFVLVDFGPDGGFQGGDDTEATYPLTEPAQGEWISLDIPLSELSTFTGRENFAQLILGAGPAGSPTVFVDNIYFHN